MVGPDLVIETEDAKPITRTNSFYLVLKPANCCGGIASISSAAAQLGASFLKLFQTIVFDPQARSRGSKATLAYVEQPSPPPP